MPYTHATIDVNRAYRVIGIYRAQSRERRNQFGIRKQEAGNQEVKDVNEGTTGRAATPVAAAYAGITGSATTPVGAVLRRAEDCQPYLICERQRRSMGRQDG